MPISDTISQLETTLDQDRAALGAALSDLRSSLTLRGFAALAVETARAHPLPAATAVAGLGAMAYRKFAPDTPEPPPAPDIPVWMAEADGLRARAAGMLEQIDAALRDGRAAAPDLLQRRTEVLAALTTDVRAALARGLDAMPEAERRRSMAAREADYAAHLGVSDRDAAEDADSGTSAMAIAGMVALVGAAVAILMPHTELEDRLFGDARSRLLEDAGKLIEAEAHRSGYLMPLLMSLLGGRR